MSPQPYKRKDIVNLKVRFLHQLLLMHISILRMAEQTVAYLYNQNEYTLFSFLGKQFSQIWLLGGTRNRAFFNRHLNFVWVTQILEKIPN